jgi:hypothetical protein
MRSAENRRQDDREGISRSIHRAGDRKKTDLLALSPANLGTEGLRDELSTQTQAEDWFLKSESGADQCALGFEVRETLDFVGALPPAAEDESVKLTGILRQRITGVGMNNAQGDTKISQHIGHETGFVDIPMLNEEHIFHASKVNTPNWRMKRKKAALACISALPRRLRMEKLRPVRPDCRIENQHHAQTLKPYAKCHR